MRIAIERSIEARPCRRRLAAEPGILALGILAGRGPARRERLLAAHLAVEEGGDLAHADRAHHRRKRRQSSLQKRTNLLNPFVGKDFLEPLVAARVEPVARRQQDERRQRDRPADAAGLLRLPVAERSAGRADHFERARDSGRVARPDPRRGLGILARQRGMGLGGRQRPHRLADRRIDLRAPARCRRSGCGYRGRCRRPGSAAGPPHAPRRSPPWRPAAQSAAEQASAPSR